MPFVSGIYVRRIAQLAFGDFVPDTFTSDTELEAFIDSDLIPKAEDIVEQYCHTNWTDTTVSEGIRAIVGEVAARMLWIMILRKMGPLVKTGDYRIEFANEDLLSDAHKKALEAYIANEKYNKGTTAKTDEYEDEWA